MVGFFFLFSCCLHLAIALRHRAHRKKSTGKNAKAVKDENTKDLFENGEWARNDVTMERVGKSVQMFSFIKDGQAKGDRVDTSISVVEAGQTFRIRLQDFMYEDKKTGNNVFPPDMDVIPAFSVVEIMISAANQTAFDAGYGLQLARVRPCDFTLLSMHSPLGLSLLPPTYEAGVQLAEGWRETNPGLKRVLEDKNIGFFGRVAQGSYLSRYMDDFRLVGPKENPGDPQSKHLSVMDGSVFAIDVRKEDLLRFSNACEEEEEDGLVYAQFVVEFAAAAGCLDCYVVYNEYLLRHDPNRSPFTGVPVIDTNRLLECIPVEELSGDFSGKRFPLPFDFAPLDRPFLTLEPVDPASVGAGKERACSDLVLASENARIDTRSYILTLGDATEEDILRFLFVPKTGGSCAGGAASGRQDYRLLKRPRIARE